MTQKYKHGEKIPSKVLVKRLEELSSAVAKGKDSILREFTMRVPAEMDRDADIVLSLSAKRIEELEGELSVLKEFSKWIKVSDKPPEKTEPIVYCNKNRSPMGVGIAYWTISEKWNPEALSEKNKQGFTHYLELPSID